MRLSHTSRADPGIPHDQRQQRRHRRWGFIWCWMACVCLAAAQGKPEPSEYEIKAVYLYNLTLFTVWPDSAFAATNAPILIGVLGGDPFGATLDEMVRDKTGRPEIVQGRPLSVKRLQSGEDWHGCQVLFICREEKENMASLLQSLKGQPVLTVSDASGFATQGGMINMVLVHGKVKLEINPAPAAAAGLKISAKLLRLATMVNPE